MRRVISTAALVMIGALVHVDGNSSSLGAQDRVATIVSAARKALGGEDKIAGLKTLTAEGPFRRSMGPRDMEGSVTLTIARPDKMKRVEEMQIGGMVGGPTIERTQVVAGTTAWEDSQNRGGMGGGGMRIMISDGPGGRPGAAGGAGPTPEQLNEARVRRLSVQLQRLLAALIADAGTPWVDAGIAEAPEGKADILETKEGTGRTLRLFIDQNTHLPLMVQYQDPKPMIMTQMGPRPGGPGAPPPPPGAGVIDKGPSGGPGGGAGIERKAEAMAGAGGQAPTPEEMQKRIAEMQRNPPPLGTYSMSLSDYKKVDGIMLPHKIETSLDGEPNEEWTIEKYKINPQLKADAFDKK